MDICIPCEQAALEQRVALTPAGCAVLSSAGHRVFVEAGAGRGAGHPDDDYVRHGAHLVWSHEEALGRGGLVLKVQRPTADELRHLPPGGTVAGLLHLEAAPPEVLEGLAVRGLTALSLELLVDGGERVVEVAMGEIAGRLAPQLAGRYLERSPINPEGRGVLLEGIPGVPAAEVVVLGAGIVGSNAARSFAALGAQVTLLDVSIARLRQVERTLPGMVRCGYASPTTVARSVGYADVLLGAAASPGQRAPVLVSDEVLAGMRPGAFILDYAIDAGGCIASSRPTTLDQPVFSHRGVIHCCLPNLPALVPRTASHALSHVMAPLLAGVGADLGAALERAPLRSALTFLDGRPVTPWLVEAMGQQGRRA